MSDPRRYAPVRWPASRGTNGRFAMEQMAAFAWNRWPESVEYAYCPACALPARLEARHRASQRYQTSLQGRLNHAARQRRYREKKTEKVTHNGSVEAETPVAHSTQRNPSISSAPATAEIIICHFCGVICSPFLRAGYLLHPD